MCKFIHIIYNKDTLSFSGVEFIPRIMFLYSGSGKHLDDDYAHGTSFERVLSLIERCAPFFWAIIDEKSGDFAGFVFLDNLIGNCERLHSAELTTCFERSFWGDFTKLAAKEFLKFCFEKYGFKKIKAQVYPENFRVKTLLRCSGFEKEALLKAETVRNGKLQDIEIYSVINEKTMRGEK